MDLVHPHSGMSLCHICGRYISSRFCFLFSLFSDLVSSPPIMPCAQMRASAFKCKCKCNRRIKCKCKCSAYESNANASANAQQLNQMQMHLNQMQMHLNQMRMNLYQMQTVFYKCVFCVQQVLLCLSISLLLLIRPAIKSKIIHTHSNTNMKA